MWIHMRAVTTRSVWIPLSKYYIMSPRAFLFHHIYFSSLDRNGHQFAIGRNMRNKKIPVRKKNDNTYVYSVCIHCICINVYIFGNISKLHPLALSTSRISEVKFVGNKISNNTGKKRSFVHFCKQKGDRNRRSRQVSHHIPWSYGILKNEINNKSSFI